MLDGGRALPQDPVGPRHGALVRLVEAREDAVDLGEVVLVGDVEVARLHLVHEVARLGRREREEVRERVDGPRVQPQRPRAPREAEDEAQRVLVDLGPAGAPQAHEERELRRERQRRRRPLLERPPERVRDLGGHARVARVQTHERAVRLEGEGELLHGRRRRPGQRRGPEAQPFQPRVRAQVRGERRDAQLAQVVEPQVQDAGAGAARAAPRPETVEDRRDAHGA